MSGSASVVSLFTNIAGTGDPILNALYGTTTGGGNPIQALQVAAQNQPQDVAATAAQPAVSRDVAAFEQAVASAKTPADLLNNPTALKVLLTANGLGDQAGYTALAQKALLSDPSDPNSLVNQLSDTSWKTVAQTYQFATKGLSVLQDPKVLSTIAEGYAEVQWRQSLDATTPGLSNALTFRSEASSITSVDQILGDPIMRSVVTTALGIPEQIAFQDITAQEKSITSQIDIARFQEPQFVTSITDQYLLAMQQQSASTTAPSIESLAAQAQGLIA
ncbi:MAG: DUF1217 domain-containing protein [Alphaproteobacteria bacterium]|nr:DUF1217 domain-containing protein [Alphaproteobacteria bacterium]